MNEGKRDEKAKAPPGTSGISERHQKVSVDAVRGTTKADRDQATRGKEAHR